MGVFLPRALDWRGCDVQKYLLIWAGKYEKEWAKFGLGISIILRRRTESMRTGVTHTYARSCQNCQRRRTRTMNGTSILHIFCPRAQTNIFVRSGKGETIEKRASKRRWKILLAGNSLLNYDFLHVEDIIWRETLDSTTISYTWKIFGGRLLTLHSSYTWRILFGGKLLTRLQFPTSASHSNRVH